jgi:hypothetical protein
MAEGIPGRTVDSGVTQLFEREALTCRALGDLVLDTRLDGKINEHLQQAPTRVCLGLSSQGNGGFTGSPGTPMARNR